MTLLDAYLANPDAVERHAIHVHAPPAVVMHALWEADLGGPVARTLVALRCLPAALAGSVGARARLRALRSGPAVTLAELQRAGFTLLGETPGREIVLGLTGRFWTPAGGVVATDPATWAAGPPPGSAQAAWNFTASAAPGGGTLLATETRVRCADAGSRRSFRMYWLVVRPFSGLLRRFMLRNVRRAAERA